MNILALDTTSEFGSLAVRADGQTLSELAIHSPEGFAHLIFPAIKVLLSEATIRLENIDCFASASGPGSFTGVRIGLAAVKGLAQATSKPAVGVSNLQALGSFGNLPLRAVAIDARRGDVYAAVYDSNLQPIVPEAVLKMTAWLASLEAPAYQFISPLGRGILDGTRFAEMPFLQPPRSRANALARSRGFGCQLRAPLRCRAVLERGLVRKKNIGLVQREPAQKAVRYH